MPQVEVAPHSHGGAVEGAPAQSKLEAFTSYDVDDFPVPNGREEEWRFTPLRRLRHLHDGKAGADGKVVVEVDAAPEVQVETVGRDDPRLGRSFVPNERISAQAYTGFRQATVITVPKNTVASKPTVVHVRGEGVEAAAYGHTVVRVEPLAEATIVFDHAGSALYADNIEFVVGDGARLSVVSVQDWADDSVHVSRHHARLSRDAKIKTFVVTLGGDVVRLSPSVAYDGPGGDAELQGLYFVDAGQHLEHRLFVDHSEPNCRSRVEYKGALQGEKAHAVWIGDVLIQVQAEGTDTYEHNRNLVLTDGALVDSVPNLEILTGEIQMAGHASASGRLDDLQMFYLMARGISLPEARRLVIRGFFAAQLAHIEVPEIRERVMAAIEAELEKSLA
ncbi:MAG TPA: Fe-S cluster assembly protein SufD [Streptosporangiaceae bacterium]